MPKRGKWARPGDVATGHRGGHAREGINKFKTELSRVKGRIFRFKHFENRRRFRKRKGSK